MTLLVDTFWNEASTRLIPAGWIITEGSRYDPTHLVGITPSGKSFTFDAIDGTITIVIAGRSRSIQRSRDLWEPGEATVDVMIEARDAFPVNQR